MIASNRPRPQFQIGQLVHHRRYGYRGVVVDWDPFCKAPDAWYHANSSQPDREQPWYHVLIDGGERVTYAAQTSLESDEAGRPVNNPLVELFFGPLAHGRYVRNDRPWEGGW